MRFWVNLALRGAACLGTPVFGGACGPSDGGANSTGGASGDTGGKGSTGGTTGETSPSTGTASGESGVGTAGSTADDDTAVETSSDAGATMDPPEIDCLELQWTWTNENEVGSFATHVVLDGQLRVLETEASGPGAARVLRGFDLDGEPTLGPIVVASGASVDMAARPGGGLLFGMRDDDSSVLALWSSAGEPVESADVSSMGDALSGPVVLAHSDGSVVFGGAVVSAEQESVLQARDDGGVSWERRGDYKFVLALEGTGAGVTLALLGNNPVVEGYDVFVAAYDPLGELLWSVPAGSVGGVFNMSLPSYDFVALGEGPVTLGSLVELDTPTREGRRDLVVSRYGAGDSVPSWSTSLPFVDEPSTDMGDGDIAVVGEQIVAIGGRTIPTIAVVDFDGGVLCSGGLVVPGQDVHIADIQPVDTDTLVLAGSVTATGADAPPRTWIASLTVKP